MKLFVLFSLLIHLALASSSSDLDCFLDHQECEIYPDNLITTVTDVLTMDQCLALCQDELTCVAFTHFGSESYPLRESCMMFSSCSTRRPCQGCTSGSSQSECLCSIKYSSEIDAGNFVGIISAVDEHECKRRCITEDMCKVYTYYDSEDPMNPNTCFMMNANGIQSPVLACDYCATGPGRCEVNQRCQAAVITNGSSTQAIFAEESMNLNLVAAEKDCFVDLSTVAIGGGGGIGDYYHGGSGSGYVETATLRMSLNSPEAEIIVGELGQSSKVEFAGGEIVLEALPGKVSQSGSGGAGYSGGGGYERISGGIGGSDGSDGDSAGAADGGKGSGSDLTLLTLKNFILTPGRGGQPNGGAGGGGGGVAVNGKIPHVNGQYAGVGFGGGSANYGSGYHGCVIVEI